LSYANKLAKERYKEGFVAEEVIRAVELVANTMSSSLLELPQLARKEKWIYDEIHMTSQLIADEIEDTYWNATL